LQSQAPRGTGTPLLIVPSTCPRPGLTIRPAWQLRMCQPRWVSPPSRRRGAVRRSGGRQHLRGRRDRDGVAPSWQGLRPSTPGSAGRWVAGTAEEIAKDLEPSVWQRLSAGEGTQGPCPSDRAYLELADPDADQYGGSATGTWTRGLLIPRSLADGKCAYFTTCARPRPRSRSWSPSRGSAGPLKTHSRRRRMSSASTTMRPEAGTAGTVTSRTERWPSPCWRPFVIRQTSNRPKKL
jgi:hypothetical protein